VSVETIPVQSPSMLGGITGFLVWLLEAFGDFLNNMWDWRPGKRIAAAKRWRANGTVLDYGDELAAQRAEDGFPISLDVQTWLPAEVMPSLANGSLETVANAVLFDTVQINDISQGSLGDCWLIAAIASLSEFPDVIRRCFQTSQVSPEGLYTCRLYDPTGKTGTGPLTIRVNDLVPCQRFPSYFGTAWWSFAPQYCRPNGNELWTMILEKACAKVMGGYEHLNGGSISYAWAMLLGPKGHSYMMKTISDDGQNVWTQYDISKFVSRSEFYVVAGDEMDDDEMFEYLLDLDSSRVVMGAAQGGYSGSAGGEPVKDNGLVRGHAYSVVEIQQAEGLHMALLRNPWGDAHEWNGAWSDTSPLWDTPLGRNVATTLKYEESERSVSDGLFWMEWKDFVSEWDIVPYSKLPWSWTTSRGRNH